jgi:predicted nucleic acid-binding Zn ribbon protein
MQVISTKIILFIMHSCILLNLHVTIPFLSKVGCSDCRNILWCSQESQHGGAILWYLELVLDVLSLYVYKAEMMYMFR